MATILVIEDDDQIRTILREVLEEEGYDVVEARDGKEGAKIYRNISSDLVITDMVMPKRTASRPSRICRQCLQGENHRYFRGGSFGAGALSGDSERVWSR